jgi:hypothetical protein
MELEDLEKKKEDLEYKLAKVQKKIQDFSLKIDYQIPEPEEAK